MLILGKFNYELSGAGDLPKMVFLHGLMGSAANWRAVVPAFIDKYQILTFDQRGHGRSFQPLDRYAPEDFAADLLAILDELGWNKVTLIGHSMGGRNALSFANSYPKRIEALVIEDIGPEISSIATERIRNLLESVPTPFSSRSAARLFFQNDFIGLHSSNPRAKAIGQYLYTNIKENDQGELDWRFYKKGVIEASRQGRAKDRGAEVAALSMPTLWIRGAESVEFSQEVYDGILRCNKKIRGVVIPNAAHWVHFDQVELFIEALQEFLQAESVNGF